MSPVLVTDLLAHRQIVLSVLALLGGVLLLAIATDSAAITNGLAHILLGARLGQSIVHLVSTSDIAIQARFVLFLIQFIIVIYWVFGLFAKFL